MTCKICKSQTKKSFSATILDRHTIDYFFCDTCHFLQTEEPYWLEEAYGEAINATDTGIMQRNLNLSKRLLPVLFHLFDHRRLFLDYAGGYGIFTRLMRDKGLDFRWMDKFAQNLVARGFEYEDGTVEAITTFESFEHFVNPIEEITTMFKISDTIVFSTELLPSSVPKPDSWWYYALEHGQHISFYSFKTLEKIAEQFDCRLFSQKNLHILTRKQLDETLLEVLFYNQKGFVNKFKRRQLLKQMKKSLKSKTSSDMDYLIQKAVYENTL